MYDFNEIYENKLNDKTILVNDGKKVDHQPPTLTAVVHLQREDVGSLPRSFHQQMIKLLKYILGMI